MDQCNPERPLVTRPTGRGDELQRSLLQDAGDEEIIDQPSTTQTLEGGPVGANGTDP
jgi:hypothetical protein